MSKSFCQRFFLSPNKEFGKPHGFVFAPQNFLFFDGQIEGRQRGRVGSRHFQSLEEQSLGLFVFYSEAILTLPNFCITYFEPLKIPLSVSSLSIRFQPSLCLVPQKKTQTGTQYRQASACGHAANGKSPTPCTCLSNKPRHNR